MPTYSELLASFRDEIDANVKARQDSLLDVIRLTTRYQFTEKDKFFLLHHSTPIVYSIWEGFIQTAFQNYIHKLNQLELKSNELNDVLLIYYMETKFKQFNEYPEKENKKITFFKDLRNSFDSNIQFTNVVNTQSNVKFEIINTLLKNFVLQPLPEWYEKINVKTKLNTLVNHRNAIAHGNDASSISINSENIKDSINLVSLLMELVSERIIEGFENKTYLINP